MRHKKDFRTGSVSQKREETRIEHKGDRWYTGYDRRLYDSRYMDIYRERTDSGHIYSRQNERAEAPTPRNTVQEGRNWGSQERGMSSDPSNRYSHQAHRGEKLLQTPEFAQHTRDQRSETTEQVCINNPVNKYEGLDKSQVHYLPRCLEPVNHEDAIGSFTHDRRGAETLSRPCSNFYQIGTERENPYQSRTHFNERDPERRDPNPRIHFDQKILERGNSNRHETHIDHGSRERDNPVQYRAHFDRGGPEWENPDPVTQHGKVNEGWSRKHYEHEDREKVIPVDRNTDQHLTCYPYEVSPGRLEKRDKIDSFYPESVNFTTRGNCGWNKSTDNILRSNSFIHEKSNSVNINSYNQNKASVKNINNEGIRDSSFSGNFLPSPPSNLINQWVKPPNNLTSIPLKEKRLQQPNWIDQVRSESSQFQRIAGNVTEHQRLTRTCNVADSRNNPVYPQPITHHPINSARFPGIQNSAQPHILINKPNMIPSSTGHPLPQLQFSTVMTSRIQLPSQHSYKHDYRRKPVNIVTGKNVPPFDVKGEPLSKNQLKYDQDGGFTNDITIEGDKFVVGSYVLSNSNATMDVIRAVEPHMVDFPVEMIPLPELPPAPLPSACFQPLLLPPPPPPSPPQEVIYIPKDLSETHELKSAQGDIVPSQKLKPVIKSVESKINIDKETVTPGLVVNVSKTDAQNKDRNSACKSQDLSAKSDANKDYKNKTRSSVSNKAGLEMTGVGMKRELPFVKEPQKNDTHKDRKPIPGCKNGGDFEDIPVHENRDQSVNANTKQRPADLFESKYEVHGKRETELNKTANGKNNGNVFEQKYERPHSQQDDRNNFFQLNETDNNSGIHPVSFQRKAENPSTGLQDKSIYSLGALGRDSGIPGVARDQPESMLYPEFMGSSRHTGSDSRDAALYNRVRRPAIINVNERFEQNRNNSVDRQSQNCRRVYDYHHIPASMCRSWEIPSLYQNDKVGRNTDGCYSRNGQVSDKRRGNLHEESTQKRRLSGLGIHTYTERQTMWRNKNLQSTPRHSTLGHFRPWVKETNSPTRMGSSVQNKDTHCAAPGSDNLKDNARSFGAYENNKSVSYPNRDTFNAQLIVRNQCKDRSLFSPRPVPFVKATKDCVPSDNSPEAGNLFKDNASMYRQSIESDLKKTPIKCKAMACTSENEKKSDRNRYFQDNVTVRRIVGGRIAKKKISEGRPSDRLYFGQVNLLKKCLGWVNTSPAKSINTKKTFLKEVRNADSTTSNAATKQPISNPHYTVKYDHLKIKDLKKSLHSSSITKPEIETKLTSLSNVAFPKVNTAVCGTLEVSKTGLSVKSSVKNLANQRDVLLSKSKPISEKGLVSVGTVKKKMKESITNKYPELVKASKSLKSTKNLKSVVEALKKKASTKNLKSLLEEFKEKAKLLEKKRGPKKVENKNNGDNKDAVNSVKPEIEKTTRMKTKEKKPVSGEASKSQLERLHPKLRHKMTNVLSTEKNTDNKSDSNMEILPKLTVVVEKCNLELLSESGTVDVSKVEVSRRKSKRLAKVKGGKYKHDEKKKSKEDQSKVKRKVENDEYGRKLKTNSESCKDKNVSITETEGKNNNEEKLGIGTPYKTLTKRKSPEKPETVKEKKLKISINDSAEEQSNVKRKMHSLGSLKRGNYVLSTPTTFEVKPHARSTKLSEPTQVSDTEEKQPKDDLLAKACFAAKKQILYRALAIEALSRDKSKPLVEKKKHSVKRISSITRSMAEKEQRNLEECISEMEKISDRKSESENVSLPTVTRTCSSTEPTISCSVLNLDTPCTSYQPMRTALGNYAVQCLHVPIVSSTFYKVPDGLSSRVVRNAKETLVGYIHNESESVETEKSSTEYENEDIFMPDNCQDQSKVNETDMKYYVDDDNNRRSPFIDVESTSSQEGTPKLIVDENTVSGEIEATNNFCHELDMNSENALNTNPEMENEEINIEDIEKTRINANSFNGSESVNDAICSVQDMCPKREDSETNPTICAVSDSEKDSEMNHSLNYTTEKSRLHDIVIYYASKLQVPEMHGSLYSDNTDGQCRENDGKTDIQDKERNGNSEIFNADVYENYEKEGREMEGHSDGHEGEIYDNRVMGARDVHDSEFYDKPEMEDSETLFPSGMQDGDIYDKSDMQGTGSYKDKMQDGGINDICAMRGSEVCDKSILRDREMYDKPEMQDAEIYDKSEIQDSEIYYKSEMQDSGINDKCAVRVSEIYDKSVLRDSEMYDKSEMQDSEIYKAEMKDGGIDDKCAMRDTEIYDISILRDSEMYDKPEMQDSGIYDEFEIQDSEICDKSEIQDGDIHDKSVMQDSEICGRFKLRDSEMNDKTAMPDSRIYDESEILDSKIYDKSEKQDSGTCDKSDMPNKGIYDKSKKLGTGIYDESGVQDYEMHIKSEKQDSEIYDEMENTEIYDDSEMQDSGIFDKSDVQDHEMCEKPAMQDGDIHDKSVFHNQVKHTSSCDESKMQDSELVHGRPITERHVHEDEILLSSRRFQSPIPSTSELTMQSPVVTNFRSFDQFDMHMKYLKAKQEMGYEHRFSLNYLIPYLPEFPSLAYLPQPKPIFSPVCRKDHMLFQPESPTVCYSSGNGIYSPTLEDFELYKLSQRQRVLENETLGVTDPRRPNACESMKLIDDESTVQIPQPDTTTLLDLDFETGQVDCHKTNELAELSAMPLVKHLSIEYNNGNNKDLPSKQTYLGAPSPKEWANCGPDVPEDKILPDHSRNLFEDMIEGLMKGEEGFLSPTWNITEPSITTEDDLREVLTAERRSNSDHPLLPSIDNSSEHLEKQKISPLLQGLSPLFNKKHIKFNEASMKEDAFQSSNVSEKNKSDDFISARTPIRVRDFRKRRFQKHFPEPMPKAKRSMHVEEDLYKTAQKFLGDFDLNNKRSCREKKKELDDRGDEMFKGNNPLKINTKKGFIEAAKVMQDKKISTASSDIKRIKVLEEKEITKDKNVVDFQDENIRNSREKTKSGLSDSSKSKRVQTVGTTDRIDNLKIETRSSEDGGNTQVGGTKTSTEKEKKSHAKGCTPTIKARKGILKKKTNGKLQSLKLNIDAKRNNLIKTKKKTLKAIATLKRNLENRTKNGKTHTVKNKYDVRKKVALMRIKNISNVDSKSAFKIVKIKKQNKNPEKIDTAQNKKGMNIKTAAMVKKMQLSSNDPTKSTELKSKQKGRYYKCKLCSNLYKSESQLKLHYSREHGTWCIRCRRQFPDSDARRKHVNRNHDVETYCGTCSVSFVWRRNYHRHLISAVHVHNEEWLALHGERLKNRKRLKNRNNRSINGDFENTKMVLSIDDSENDSQILDESCAIVIDSQDEDASSKGGSLVGNIKRKLANETSSAEPVAKKANRLEYCSTCDKSYAKLKAHMKTEKHQLAVKYQNRKRSSSRVYNQVECTEEMTPCVSDIDHLDQVDMGRTNGLPATLPFCTETSMVYPAGTFTPSNTGNNTCSPVLLVKNIATEFMPGICAEATSISVEDCDVNPATTEFMPGICTEATSISVEDCNVNPATTEFMPGIYAKATRTISVEDGAVHPSTENLNDTICKSDDACGDIYVLENLESRANYAQNNTTRANSAQNNAIGEISFTELLMSDDIDGRLTVEQNDLTFMDSVMSQEKVKVVSELDGNDN